MVIMPIDYFFKCFVKSENTSTCYFCTQKREGISERMVIIMANKQKGKTEVYPFWYMEDIKNMMDYFKTKEMWHWYLVFNFGLLLGRREIGRASCRERV